MERRLQLHVDGDPGLTAGSWSAGDFASAGTHEGGSLPISLVAADLGDEGLAGFFSRVDVLAVDFGTADLTRFKSFAPAIDLFASAQGCDAGTVPVSAALGDLNGDGSPDVVVANAGSGDVSVLLGVSPALAQRFGSGCPGTGGLVPEITSDGRPVSGSSDFAVNLRNGKPFAPALMALSLSQATTPLGGGCTLYLGQPLVLVQRVTNAAGEATVGLAVPAGLDGLDVYFQWAVFDPSGAFGGLLAFSDALRAQLGE